MFKSKKANSKGNKYKYNGMVAHDWGGLLDEPGKPGRRDCCLLRRVANCIKLSPKMPGGHFSIYSLV